jgi:predicted RNA binding protein YcfA (HicA-like mRNA interferase family)
MNFRELEKIVKADGWRLDRIQGSHCQYEHPTKRGIVINDNSAFIARSTAGKARLRAISGHELSVSICKANGHARQPRPSFEYFQHIVSQVRFRCHQVHSGKQILALQFNYEKLNCNIPRHSGDVSKIIVKSVLRQAGIAIEGK